jgi:FAD/FMN-containing dehydrogenase
MALNLRREQRHGWGMVNHSVCHVGRPTSAEEVVEAYGLARENNWTISFWGNGRSYGDAALNESQLLLDFRGMCAVLAFDKEAGHITLEPGITLHEIEHHVLPHGWFPPVVSGTMHTTIGGCISANVHGKNNWKFGPWGDHVLELTLVTPDGQTRVLTRDAEAAEDRELFHFVIGGFGLLGALVAVKVQLKKVYSGRLWVVPIAADSLREMFRHFRRLNEAEYDYVVGWIDAFPGGAGLGRGQIHAARYCEPGEDPEGTALMDPKDQTLPTRMFGIVPMAWLWWLGRPARHRLGFRLINFGRFWWMKLLGHEGVPHLESHIRFNHLLDFVPNWHWIHKPGGLIQYQLFLPKETAEQVVGRVLELCRAEQLESWLVVMKRHRSDAYPLSHAVDGYSFAMDFHVNANTRGRLARLARRLDHVVVEAGGRFYFAKDSVVAPEAWRRSLGDAVVGRFFALKRRVDPSTLIQGNLWRRVMAPLVREVPLLDERLPVFDAQPEAIPATIATEADEDGG